MLRRTLALCLLIALLAACAPPRDDGPPGPSTPATAAASRVPATTPARPAVTPTATPTVTPALAPLVDATSVSPDGRWTAHTFASAPVVSGTVAPGDVGPEVYHALLVIARVDGSVAWTVVDEWANYGLGWTAPQVVRWTRDGRALYYTNYPVSDGCAMFVDGWDLWRVDLGSGAREPIIAQSNLVLSLSPDDATLVYLDGRDPVQIVRRDLATGAEQRAPLALEPGWQAGDIVWAPDGRSFTLAISTAPCDPAGDHPLTVRVELATLAQERQ